jgi:hypothetical protein
LQVLNLILKLIALRPLLSMAVFGIPVIGLILLGLFAVAVLKIVLILAIPAGVLFWVMRSRRKSASTM